MPSEITHKSPFRPGKYLFGLLVALGIGWVLGINGFDGDPVTVAPIDQRPVALTPCVGGAP